MVFASKNQLSDNLRLYEISLPLYVFTKFATEFDANLYDFIFSQQWTAKTKIQSTTENLTILLKTAITVFPAELDEQSDGQ